MKYKIRGEKVEITDSIRNYIEEKIDKLNKYFSQDDDLNVSVVIKVRGKEQKIEITIPTAHFTLRSEESHSDLYAAIDLTVDKLERQIRKNKTKINSKIKKNLIQNFELDLEDKLDSMEFKFRNNHFDRLSNNACGSAIAASVYADILGNLERMGDHCRNIGRSTVSDMPLGNHVDF